MKKAYKREMAANKKLQLIPFQDRHEYMRDYYSMLRADEELTRSVEKEMAMEEKRYVRYLRGRKTALLTCSLETNTTLSPMYFTHCTPGKEMEDELAATTGASLQVFSFKIAEIKAGLQWPLYVYGVVAARDKVDYNRNLLFNRTRDNAQLVTLDDPFLRLIGPARGILPDPDFEVELRVKGRTKYRDRALINDRHPYIGSFHYDGHYTVPFWNCLCRCELSTELLGKSVQATILGVRIVKGTFRYGGRVAFSSPSHQVAIVDSQGAIQEVIDPLSTMVVLLDSRYCHGGEMPMSSDDYLDLTRRVVSVELRESHFLYPEKLEETFKVVIQVYSKCGDIAAQGHVKLTPKLSNISQTVCYLGDSVVEIIVAWSVHVEEKVFL